MRHRGALAIDRREYVCMGEMGPALVAFAPTETFR
jgi:hypothetical protein